MGIESILVTLYKIIMLCFFNRILSVYFLVPELIVMMLYFAGFCICSDDPQAKVRSLKGFSYIFLILYLLAGIANITIGSLGYSNPAKYSKIS